METTTGTCDKAEEVMETTTETCDEADKLLNASTETCDESVEVPAFMQQASDFVESTDMSEPGPSSANSTLPLFVTLVLWSTCRLLIVGPLDYQCVFCIDTEALVFAEFKKIGLEPQNNYSECFGQLFYR